ncbi:MAG: hypothetical protein ACTHQM_24820 [Thermoanaerobaculia bacterium]
MSESQDDDLVIAGDVLQRVRESEDHFSEYAQINDCRDLRIVFDHSDRFHHFEQNPLAKSGRAIFVEDDSFGELCTSSLVKP